VLVLPFPITSPFPQQLLGGGRLALEHPADLANVLSRERLQHKFARPLDESNLHAGLMPYFRLSRTGTTSCPLLLSWAVSI
jgi:hypothetical protein